MPSRSGAGSLDKMIEFQQPVIEETPQGGTVTRWEPACSVHGRLMPKLGGEGVVAGRLEGIQPYILTVRSSSDTRKVKPSWRAVSVRTGAIYNIRSVTNVDERNAYLEMMVVENEVSA